VLRRRDFNDDSGRVLVAGRRTLEMQVAVRIRFVIGSLDFANNAGDGVQLWLTRGIACCSESVCPAGTAHVSIRASVIDFASASDAGFDRVLSAHRS